MFCIKCGAMLDKDARFCTGCGEKVYLDENSPVNLNNKAEPYRAQGHISQEPVYNPVQPPIQPPVAQPPVAQPPVAEPPVVSEKSFIVDDPDKTIGVKQYRSRKPAGEISPEKHEEKKEDIKPAFTPVESEAGYDNPVENKVSDSVRVNRPVNKGFSFDIDEPIDDIFNEELGGSFFDDDDNDKNEAPKGSPEKKKAKSKLPLIIGGAAAVAAVAAAVFFLVLNPGKASYSNSFNMSSDIISVSRNADTVYYINENGYITENNIADDERSIIVSDVKSDMVYLYGEKLYFRDKEENYLYTCDTYGDNIEKVVSSRICWFTILEDELYYIDGYYEVSEDGGEKTPSGQFNLYKSKTDGSDEKQIINDNVAKVFIGKNDIVYYNEEAASLYRTDIDGEDRKLLYACEDSAYIGDIKVEKDTVLFTCIDEDNRILSGVYSVGLDGEGKKKVVNTTESSITLRNGKLIYTSSSDNATYMSNIDGSDEDEIIDIPAYSPVVSGNFMYFFNSDDEKLSVMEYDFKEDSVRYLEGRLYRNTVFTKNYIFYIDNDDNNIYRCDHNGKDAVQLTDGECTEIFEYDGDIYFLGYANGYNSEESATMTGIETYGLYKLDAEGESCTIVQFDCGEDACLYDGYVYYTSGDEVKEIYRTELSNEDTTLPELPYITEIYGLELKEIQFVADGYIYLTAIRDGKDELVRVDIETKFAETVYEGTLWNASYSDGKIFYMAENDDEDAALYYMTSDGKNSEGIIVLDISEYVVSGSTVYYIDPESSTLCVIGINGSNQNTLCDTAVSDLAIYDGYVYFTDRYEEGHIYCIETTGGTKEEVIAEIDDATDKTAYKTHGVDGATPEIPTAPVM